jgi:hypothetical protein
MDDNKTPVNASKFECIMCDYKCSKQSDWLRHISRPKHQKNENGINKTPKNADCLCNCGKVYKHSTGLWRHKKTCNYTPDVEQPNMSDMKTLTTLVLDVVKSNTDLQKQNQELQKQMIDICKNGVNTTTNTQTINNNSNNKSFNLNVFLNETCKDAMNMKDFVDSIQITLTDIENMGKLGFVNGISNIIVNRLKAIDVHLRPVHCTDQRRETMYVKEKNQWNKEEDDNKNIRRFIQLVAHKNTKNLSLFKNKHPDCLEYHSKYNDQYNKIVMETFGGYGNTDYDSENKIIRKLVKELAIDKST